MADVIKVYRQEIGASRFIGKKYSDDDRVNGSFGVKWGEWFENDRFKLLENLVDSKVNETYEDGSAYIGLMRHKDGEPFQYWVGMFLPPETIAPENFDFIDFQKSSLGVGWLQGPEDDLYAQEHKCAEKLSEIQCEIVNDKDGACWFFERYMCPRFTEQDEKGNRILDICFFVK